MVKCKHLGDHESCILYIKLVSRESVNSLELKLWCFLFEKDSLLICLLISTIKYISTPESNRLHLIFPIYYYLR